MNSKFRNFPEERLGVLESENRYMDGWCLHEHTNVFVYKTWYITQRQETFFKAFFVLFIFSIKEIIKTLKKHLASSTPYFSLKLYK